MTHPLVQPAHARITQKSLSRRPIREGRILRLRQRGPAEGVKILALREELEDFAGWQAVGLGLALRQAPLNRSPAQFGKRRQAREAAEAGRLWIRHACQSILGGERP